MQLYGMDPELVDIYNIRHLQSIKVWDLVDESGSKTLIVPAILIYYDGGKYLNLCSKDKYFDIFVKKVMEVYHDEKNNIVEDALTDPFRMREHIDIDPKSRRILESGELLNRDAIYEFYKDKEAYNQSLIFQIDDVRSFIPIIKYHLEKLFTFTDRHLSLEDDLLGYHDNYVLKGKLDGIDYLFPFTFERCSEDMVIINIASVLKNEPIKMTIAFKSDGLEVTLDHQSDLKVTSSMKITNGTIKGIMDIMRKGITVRYTNIDLLECEKPPLSDLDYETNLKWFKLPWNAYYGIDTSIDTISDDEKIIGIDSVYLGISDQAFYKKEFYSKRYKRQKTATKDADDMILSEVDKSILGYKLDEENGLYVIETSFADNTTDYNHRNRYYYHIVMSKDLSSINKEDLRPIGKREEVISKTDLANNYKLLELVKGE